MTIIIYENTTNTIIHVQSNIDLGREDFVFKGFLRRKCLDSALYGYTTTVFDQTSLRFRAGYTIENGEVAKRLVMPIVYDKTEIFADTEDAITLTGLPDPCTVTYIGPGFTQDGEVTGGTAVFTTDTPGTHTVKVVAFPYLDWEGTFNAV